MQRIALGAGPGSRSRGSACLDRLAGTHGTSVDAVAMAAVLANPWADAVLSGTVTPGQLRSNASALGLSLSEDELAELQTLAEAPEAYWRTRSELAWS